MLVDSLMPAPLSERQAEKEGGGASPPAGAGIGHIPVMTKEILSAYPKGFCPRTVFDCSFGRGGHSLALLKKFPKARITAIDRDQEALACGSFLKPVKDGRIKLIYGNFHDFAIQDPAAPPLLQKPPPEDKPGPGLEGGPRRAASLRGCSGGLLINGRREAFDIILIDLGPSSPQLDDARRGFSFYQEGPLDMRMDRSQKLSAAVIVNQFSRDDLARVFRECGEIKNPAPLAGAICRQRRKKPIQSAGELASIASRSSRRRRGFPRRHPATACFLALRIKVNNELDGLRQSLPALAGGLRREGHFLVVSFHSLEDRIVKKAMKSFELAGMGRVLGKKAIRPSLGEIRQNPRSRSAKLRVFVKGGNGPGLAGLSAKTGGRAE